MSDTNIVTENRPVSHNPLASMVIGLTRALSIERDAHESTREVLHEAVAMLGAQDRQLDRERANRLHLLAQYRELVSGRTKGDERQAEEHTDDTLIAERRRAA